jgi:hypothetical protein
VMRFLREELHLHPSLWPLTFGKGNPLVIPHESALAADPGAFGKYAHYSTRLTNEPYIIGFSGRMYDYHLAFQISEWWDLEHPEQRGLPVPDDTWEDCERTCFLLVKNRDTLVEEQVGSPLVNAAIGSSWTVLLAEVIRREAEEEAS